MTASSRPKPFIALVDRIRSASIQKKLLLVFGVMGTLALAQIFVIHEALNSLSAARAFVAGEGLWSKAQKNAVNDLQAYIVLNEESRYQSFKNELDVIEGDRIARLELTQEDYDPEIAAEGLLRGKNHPEDIPAMMELIRRFHWVPQIAKALDIWRQGDELIERLRSLGRRIRENVQLRPLERDEQLKYMADIREIDQRLTELEDNFSSTLGSASRKAEDIIVTFLLAVVLAFNALALWMVLRLGGYLSEGIARLNEAAAAIGRGDLSQKVEIKGKNELAELALAVNKMSRDLKNNISERVRAEKHTKTKDLFLAYLGHEIRTPLGIILGYSELMENKKLSDKEKRELARLINSTGKELSRLVDEVLDISKIELGEISVEYVDFNLNNFINEQKLLFKMRCDEKGIALDFSKEGDVPEWINCDPSRLRQILTNLISNAVKHTSRGKIEVIASVKDNTLSFDVKDTGEGIRETEQAKIFERFGRVKDSAVREGTGLGLPLAKRLAQALGGDVELASSTPGVGSRFRASVVFNEAKGRDQAE